VTLAIVLAAGSPVATVPLRSGAPLVEQLLGQWRAAGVPDVRLAADLTEVATLVEAATGPVLLCGADLVAHTAVLRHLATSPVGPTVALVLAEPPATGQAAVREERGQVVAAALVGAAGPGDADATGGATGAFGGALRVGPADLPALAAAARAAAADPAPPAGPAVDRLLTGLTRAGTLTFAHRVRLLVARRVTDAAQAGAAEAAVAAVDSDRAELRLSVKERDDFFTTYFVSSWSPWVTKLCARIGLGPTGVTMVSIVFAVAAAVLFAVGDRPALVAGAVLLYLGFMLDCVDGQLARYTRDFSPWGGWLDTMADRAKEYVVYAGLGYGVVHAGLGNGWALAIAAITLQTVRHMTDAWYGVLHDEAARRPRPATAATAGGIGGKLNQASTRVQADTGSLSYWLKRTVVFPIGERWALISLAVALFNPLVALIAVLVWGSLAFLYTFSLRTLRARWMRVSVLSTVDAGLHRDDGPLLRWLAGRRRATGGRPAGRGSPLDWLVPAGLRAAEYLFVIAVGVVGDVPPPLVFGLLFVLTLHHYDLVARLEKRQPAPPLHAFTLGWEGRSILLAVALLAGFATVGMGTLATYLFLVFVVSVILAWVITPPRPGRREPARSGAAGGPNDDSDQLRRTGLPGAGLSG
jgi:phosphatidylglycerophosphate synthase